MANTSRRVGITQEPVLWVSGEIWLYHINGGAGVQLNEKPNWQKI